MLTLLNKINVALLQIDYNAFLDFIFCYLTFAVQYVHKYVILTS